MTVTKDLRKSVFERDNYRCGNCGIELDNATAQIDHIVPLSKGGTDEFSNLRTLCPNCNVSKRDEFQIQILKATTPVAYELLKIWYKLYRSHPIKTAISTIITLIFAVVAIAYVQLLEKERTEKERMVDLSFQKQIEQLNQTENNLKKLMEFVKLQQENLMIYEDSLNSLKLEKEKYEPILKTQREQVDALFRVFEERNRKELKRERLTGFGYGVLASIVGSLVIMGVRFLFIRVRIKKDISKDTNT